MTIQAEDQFRLKGPDAEAVGSLSEEGFVVHAGAIARKETVPSATESLTSMRTRLIDDGVLEENGEQLRFTRHYVFDSPSGAAAAVLGRHANGWIEWKRSDGRTLSEVKRVSRVSGETMLSEPKRQEIRNKFEGLLNEGKIYTKPQLDQYYSTFRQRFGPDVLSGLCSNSCMTATKRAWSIGWSSRMTTSSTQSGLGA